MYLFIYLSISHIGLFKVQSIIIPTKRKMHSGLYTMGERAGDRGEVEKREEKGENGVTNRVKLLKNLL